MLLETIPKFNEYLLEETITEARPIKAWRQDAWTLRDTLILYSVHFRSTIQELCEILDREALESPIYKLISTNIRRAGNDFLQKHMFTLQIVVDSENKPCDQASSKDEDDKEDDQFQNGGFKNKLKNIVPSLLTEMFKITENSDSGYFEFYTDEGDLVPLNNDQSLSSALNLQIDILNEQLEQLKVEKLKEDADKISLAEAIKEVENEIKRLKTLKILKQ